ncbi:helix-turn-helix domain-containing protein [Roseovarius dicentrarchi]|uniref:helix-turn-helix domain-containing protein n=1 Tax=Roseovarius dicentrarchi TaxID=2250573 RepID=UPI000DE86980|nr:helix-turn-helix transcriptional regulator [Roseovarius dicentrarchi]
MTKLTKASFVNAGDRIRGLPAAKLARIEALADEMASDLHLSEIRKALSITQKDLAERTGLAQGEVSRFENAELTGAKLGTLERYVEGMGGRLRLVAEMPDGTVAEIPMTRGKPVKSKISAARR